MMAGQGDGRSVVGKVIGILDAFEPQATELTLNELAERSRLPLSTTYRRSHAVRRFHP